MEQIRVKVDADLSAGKHKRLPNNEKMSSDKLEEWARDYLAAELGEDRSLIRPSVTQQFPDIVVDKFGIEIKYVSDAKWSGVANSINESHAVAGLEATYILFGRGGGSPPGARTRLYEEAVYHARTSHRPRFEIDVTGERDSLFGRWGISYDDFRVLPWREKMGYMTAYVNSRRQDREQEFWWLPPDPRPYGRLDQAERDSVLALACLMCPQIASGTLEAKEEVAMCAMQMRSILMNETSLVFSKNVLEDLLRIEYVIEAEAETAIMDAFAWHWGVRPAKEERLSEWVKRLDAAHVGARLETPLPSIVLFGGRYAG